MWKISKRVKTEARYVTRIVRFKIERNGHDGFQMYWVNAVILQRHRVYNGCAKREAGQHRVDCQILADMITIQLPSWMNRPGQD